MKGLLITIIVAQYVGALSAAIAFSRSSHLPPKTFFVMMAGVVLFNAFCAWYLYTRAARNRVEWALFGFMVNYLAVLTFWASNGWRKVSKR
ncbi:MAG: hypothetical protein ACOYXU_07200 [Nitrospirota bacterium]